MHLGCHRLRLELTKSCRNFARGAKGATGDDYKSGIPITFSRAAAPRLTIR